MIYLRLTKPRSVALLLVTALAGMVMSGQGQTPLSVLALTMLGGAMAAAGANTLNCYLDRDLDRLMPRTRCRPIPSGLVRPWKALAFGLLLCLLSLAILATGVNPLSALLAAAGIFYYVVVYTLWLKRATPLNVVVGGGAGVMPFLVGSAAASGSVPLYSLWIGSILLLWTPPHFWSLALVRRDEYRDAGVPMLPAVRGEEETRRQIGVYALLLFLATLLALPLGVVGGVFAAVPAILGGCFLLHAALLLARGTQAEAQRLYRHSIIYLALLFSSLILGRLVAA